MNIVLADEFRDGNVPAQQAPLAVAQRAYQALPKTVREFTLVQDGSDERGSRALL
jgi:hypothetical protein